MGDRELIVRLQNLRELLGRSRSPSPPTNQKTTRSKSTAASNKSQKLRGVDTGLNKAGKISNTKNKKAIPRQNEEDLITLKVQFNKFLNERKGNKGTPEFQYTTGKNALPTKSTSKATTTSSKKTSKKNISTKEKLNSAYNYGHYEYKGNSLANRQSAVSSKSKPTGKSITKTATKHSTTRKSYDVPPPITGKLNPHTTTGTKYAVNEEAQRPTIRMKDTFTEPPPKIIPRKNRIDVSDDSESDAKINKYTTNLINNNIKKTNYNNHLDLSSSDDDTIIRKALQKKSIKTDTHRWDTERLNDKPRTNIKKDILDSYKSVTNKFDISSDGENLEIPPFTQQKTTKPGKFADLSSDDDKEFEAILKRTQQKSIKTTPIGSHHVDSGSSSSDNNNFYLNKKVTPKKTSPSPTTSTGKKSNLFDVSLSSSDSDNVNDVVKRAKQTISNATKSPIKPSQLTKDLSDSDDILSQKKTPQAQSTKLTKDLIDSDDSDDDILLKANLDRLKKTTSKETTPIVTKPILGSKNLSDSDSLNDYVPKTKSPVKVPNSDSDDFYLDREAKNQISSPKKYNVHISDSSESGTAELLKTQKKTHQNITSPAKRSILNNKNLYSDSDGDDLGILNKKPATSISPHNRIVDPIDSSDDLGLSKPITKASPKHVSPKQAMNVLDSSDDDLGLPITKASPKPVSPKQPAHLLDSSDDDIGLPITKTSPKPVSPKQAINVLDSSDDDIGLPISKTSPKPVSPKQPTNLLDSSDDDLGLPISKTSPKPVSPKQAINVFDSSDDDLGLPISKTSPKPVSPKQAINVFDSSDDDLGLSKPITKASPKHVSPKQPANLLDSSDDDLGLPITKTSPKPVSPKQAINVLDSSDDDIGLPITKASPKPVSPKQPATLLDSSDDDLGLSKPITKTSPKNVSPKQAPNVLDSSDDDLGLGHKKPTSPYQLTNSKQSSPKKPLNVLHSSDDDDFGKNIPNPAKMQPVSRFPDLSSSDDDIPISQPKSMSPSAQQYGSQKTKQAKLNTILDTINNSSDDYSKPTQQIKKPENVFGSDDSDDELLNEIKKKTSPSNTKPTTSIPFDESSSDIIPPKLASPTNKADDDSRPLQSKFDLKNLNLSSSDDDNKPQPSKKPFDSSSDESLNEMKKAFVNKTTSPTAKKSSPIPQKQITNLDDDYDSSSTVQQSIQKQPPVFAVPIDDEEHPPSPNKSLQIPIINKDELFSSDDNEQIQQVTPKRSPTLSQSPPKELQLSPPVEHHKPEKGEKSKNLLDDISSDDSDDILSKIRSATKSQSNKPTVNLSDSDDITKRPTIEVDTNLSKPTPTKELAEKIDKFINSDSDNDDWIKKTTELLDQAPKATPIDSDSSEEMNLKDPKKDSSPPKSGISIKERLKELGIAISDEDEGFGLFTIPKPPTGLDKLINSPSSELEDDKNLPKVDLKDSDSDIKTDIIIKQIKQEKVNDKNVIEEEESDDESYEKRIKQLQKEMKKETGTYDSDNDKQKILNSSSDSLDKKENLSSDSEIPVFKLPINQTKDPNETGVSDYDSDDVDQVINKKEENQKETKEISNDKEIMNSNQINNTQNEQIDVGLKYIEELINSNQTKTIKAQQMEIDLNSDEELINSNQINNTKNEQIEIDLNSDEEIINSNQIKTIKNEQIDIDLNSDKEEEDININDENILKQILEEEDSDEDNFDIQEQINQLALFNRNGAFTKVSNDEQQSDHENEIDILEKENKELEKENEILENEIKQTTQIKDDEHEEKIENMINQLSDDNDIPMNSDQMKQIINGFSDDDDSSIQKYIDQIKSEDELDKQQNQGGISNVTNEKVDINALNIDSSDDNLDIQINQKVDVNLNSNSEDEQIDLDKEKLDLNQQKVDVNLDSNSEDDSIDLEKEKAALDALNIDSSDDNLDIEINQNEQKVDVNLDNNSKKEKVDLDALNIDSSDDNLDIQINQNEQKVDINLNSNSEDEPIDLEKEKVDINALNIDSSDDNLEIQINQNEQKVDVNLDNNSEDEQIDLDKEKVDLNQQKIDVNLNSNSEDDSIDLEKEKAALDALNIDSSDDNLEIQINQNNQKVDLDKNDTNEQINSHQNLPAMIDSPSISDDDQQIDKTERDNLSLHNLLKATHELKTKKHGNNDDTDSEVMNLIQDSDSGKDIFQFEEKNDELKQNDDSLNEEEDLVTQNKESNNKLFAEINLDHSYIEEEEEDNDTDPNVATITKEEIIVQPNDDPNDDFSLSSNEDKKEDGPIEDFNAEDENNQEIIEQNEVIVQDEIVLSGNEEEMNSDLEFTAPDEKDENKSTTDTLSKTQGFTIPNLDNLLEEDEEDEGDFDLADLANIDVDIEEDDEDDEDIKAILQKLNSQNQKENEVQDDDNLVDSEKLIENLPMEEDSEEDDNVF